MTDQPNDAPKTTETEDHNRHTPRRRRFPLEVVLSAALVVVLAAALLRGADPNDVDGPLVGKTAANFTSERLDTDTLEPFPEQLGLADLKGPSH